MLKTGMLVQHKATKVIGTLIQEAKGKYIKGWQVWLKEDERPTFWYTRNIRPIAQSNEEGLVLLNKTDVL